MSFRRLNYPFLLLTLIVCSPLISFSSLAKTYKLKLSHFTPASHNYQKEVLEPWIQELKQASQGNIEVSLFPGASLCKPAQQYDCVKSGIADIAWITPGWTPGRFPLTSVLELPFLYKTAEQGNQLAYQVYQEFLKEEYHDVHLLYIFVHPASHIHTANKAIHSIQDLKGLKIRTPTALVGQTLTLLGATKIGIPAPQIYETLHRGVIDGLVMPYDGVASFRLHETATHHTEIGFYGLPFALIMNKKTFESLPSPLQSLFQQAQNPSYWQKVGKVWDKSEELSLKKIQNAKNQHFGSLSSQELSIFKKQIAPVKESWASQMTKLGHPGSKILQYVAEKTSPQP